MRPHAGHIRLDGRKLYSGRKTVVVFGDCEGNSTGPGREREGRRERGGEKKKGGKSKRKKDREKNRMVKRPSRQVVGTGPRRGETGEQSHYQGNPA